MLMNASDESLHKLLVHLFYSAWHVGRSTAQRLLNMYACGVTYDLQVLPS